MVERTIIKAMEIQELLEKIKEDVARGIKEIPEIQEAGILITDTKVTYHDDFGWGICVVIDKSKPCFRFDMLKNITGTLAKYFNHNVNWHSAIHPKGILVAPVI